MELDLKSVNRAFSRQSEGYDAYDASNAVLQWMRQRVRRHVLRYLKKGDRMLELNAGTGLDALFFVSKGCTVHATDLSDGMIRQIDGKIRACGLEEKLQVRQCSYTDLHLLRNERYDYVFSNFGGLNCIPDLKVVTDQLRYLLKPGGFATFVIMPPVCPWEIASLMKGNIKTAFRRMKRNGAPAHLEGEYFQTYYFRPSDVLKSFGPGFSKVKLEGLGSLSPPPHADRFPAKYPVLYKLLTAADERVCLLPPFRSWADHFILTVQHLPEKNDRRR